MTTSTLLQALMNGLVLASVYILVASGFALIFSIMRIVNFAHGEIYMLGAYAIFYLFGEYDMNYFLALVVSMVAIGVLGIVLERFLFLPLQAAHLSQVFLSLGLSIVLQGVASVAFGAGDKAIAAPFPGVVRFGGAALSMERLVIIPVCVALIAGLFAFVNWARLGRAMRAVAQDPDAAALQGIDVTFISCLAFAIGCALAAAAGGLIAPVFLINPFMGGGVVMKAFVIICLGGMGSITGAVVGGLVLGLVDSFGGTFLSGPIAYVLAFSMLILVLLFRPQGLLGH
jgi:branched-chain amino acid transport system permease protein